MRHRVLPERSTLSVSSCRICGIVKRCNLACSGERRTWPLLAEAPCVLMWRKRWQCTLVGVQHRVLLDLCADVSAFACTKLPFRYAQNDMALFCGK